MPTVKNIIEAALLASGEPLRISQLQDLFVSDDGIEPPSAERVREELDNLASEYEQRGIELRRVAGGYRIQVRSELAPWISRLWQERPARYSRALLETLALIAYRQPITRGEIEHVRGVSVSTSIIRTLEELDWVQVIGKRDVPGRPALYATTDAFLAHFNLDSLAQLPDLAAVHESSDKQQADRQAAENPASECAESSTVRGE
ncbi:SMC-Scp complex subunit ScpB [Halorhodospira halochloris]|uniref:SMC-Scp complex subunit ScpB n=1 Tax=Halorhodospira halochloris TaxID=1052 RepID=UPI001EE7BB2D|nr:SMC-Scp complex subunit ScpB [Halorhodospira halochloris]MCG5548544.1 SMC-Scp complex subunit ScpB [Halorhodospira halochloris]